MSLSAVALYVLARELPESHTKALLSFVPVFLAGVVLRVVATDPAVETTGLVVASLAVLGVVAVVSDGLRKRYSFDPTSYDTSS
ncbi:hypothetical protein [Haloarchaeobius sp. HRN-SO-5]|uniref:hypothetical protein n=1 Tax=Haloarchaeobius sp. HRN-SO-5 TaxID=3446118 RepID=UPI003EB7B53E